MDAAKVSAFMEAAETFHAEQATPTIPRARMRDLDASAEVVDWERLPKLRSRRFTPDREVAWSKASSLDGGEPLWVPFEMVHTDYRVPVAPYFPLASNGLASGNHRLEAICAALLELIERDATTLWRQRSSTERASRRIDLETVDHEACRELIDRLTACGIAVSVWDVTTDIGVAAFLCRIEEAANNPQPRLGGFYGSGCHLARDVAFLRAVTEAVQTRLTYIAGSRDDLRRRDYSESAGEAILSVVLPAWERGFSQRCYGDVPDASTDSFDEDVRHSRRASRRGRHRQGGRRRSDAPGFRAARGQGDRARVSNSSTTIRTTSPANGRGASWRSANEGDCLRRPDTRPRPCEAGAGYHFPSARRAWRRLSRDARLAGSDRPDRRLFRDRPRGLAQGDSLRAVEGGACLRCGEHGGAARRRAVAVRHGRRRRTSSRTIATIVSRTTTRSAIVHGPAELDYVPVTEAMVNIRATRGSGRRGVRYSGALKAIRSCFWPRRCSTRSGPGARFSPSQSVSGVPARVMRGVPRVAAGRRGRSEACRRPSHAGGNPRLALLRARTLPARIRVPGDVRLD